MKLHLKPSDFIIPISLAVAFVWAVWVTLRVYGDENKVVRLGAASIIQEYMTAAAGSSWTEQEVKQKTDVFTKTLDELIEAEAAKGHTVLMTEAVLSKNTEDITNKVRSELVKKVGWPTPAPRPAPIQLGPSGQ
ncbi:MAG: type-F conjugative transfer system protein TrbI [Sphingomonadales bacterium]|nr:type-F conjugative transfer system protein TrbI [Sphingomonadales bacterium]